MARRSVVRLCLLLAVVAADGSAAVATGFRRDVEQFQPQWHNHMNNPGMAWYEESAKGPYNREQAPPPHRQPVSFPQGAGSYTEENGTQPPRTSTVREAPSYEQPFVGASPLVAAANRVDAALADWNGQLHWPAIVLVDKEPAALRYAQRIWAGVDAELHANATFRLLVYDDNANNYRWDAEAQGVEALRQALGTLGARADSQWAATFAALQRAADAAPSLRGAGPGYGGHSAVLLFCGRPAADEHARARVTNAFLAKRAKLYVWWTGGERFQGQEYPLLQTAQDTGGEFFYVTTTPATLPPVTLPHASRTADCFSNDTQAILAVRWGLTGRTTMQVPVDSGVDVLEVIVRGQFSEVEVQPPSGFAQMHRVGQMSEDWCTESTNGGAGLVLRRQFDTRAVGSGYWTVTVDDAGGSTVADADVPRALEYDVTVAGRSRLAVKAQQAAEWVDVNEYEVFQISGASDISITGVAVRDENGAELTQLSYKQRNETGDVADLAVPIETLSKFNNYFLEVNGFNHTSGAKFVRLTPPLGSSHLDVKLASNSSLDILSGRNTQILLDIINKADKVSRVYVTASGSSVRVTLSQVRRLDLYPGRTYQMVVFLYAPVKTEDIINVYFQDETSLMKTTVQLRITADSSVQTIDTSKPKVTHKVLSKCKSGNKDCSSYRWGIELTAEDKQTGIRDITSQPQGIEWLSPISIGIKVPVRVKYSASCCQEKAIMTIRDMKYNTVEYTVDITDDGGLDPGIIAAIVIGAVLLLVIIIVIIVVVVRKRKTHTFHTQQVPR